MWWNHFGFYDTCSPLEVKRGRYGVVWYAVSAALWQIRRTQEPYLTSSLVPLCTFDHLDQHCQAASSFPYGLPKSLWPVLPYVPIACHVLCRPVPAISSLSQTSQSCTLTRPSKLELSKTGWLRPAVSCSVTQFQGFRQSWIFEIRTGYGKASLFMSWVVFDKIWKPMFILHDNYLLG